MNRSRILVVFVLLAVLGAVVAGCNSSPPSPVGSAQGGRVDGYVALVPQTLRSGESASISVSLLQREGPARDTVGVSLFDKDKRLLRSGSADIHGTGTVAFDVPQVAAGEYEVLVSGKSFSERTSVQIKAGTLLFLESDKPIYTPGQTIHMRLVALDSDLHPVRAEATLEAQDAKGIKIFKQSLTTDEYGTVTAELPLSTEPNLGVWKLMATAGDAYTQVDVRVEEYVLPKYEVKASLEKDWFPVNETIRGHVAAEYSFGRTVQGELSVTAFRYVGEWEEYATFTAPIDGEGDFTIEPAGYVAGVPEAGGSGNVRLDITVVEQSTGYEQTTTELITVASSPLRLKLIPESPAFKPTLPFSLLLVADTPSGEPVDASVRVDVRYVDKNYSTIRHEVLRPETTHGVAVLQLTPPKRAVQVALEANSGDAYSYQEVGASYSPSGSFIHVQQEGAPALAVGDTARFQVASTAQAGTVYYEVVSRGRVVFSSSTAQDISFQVTPAMAPSAWLLVYQILPNSEVAADSLPFQVKGQYPHEVSASVTSEEVRPGDEVQVRFQTEGAAKVGLVAVDHSVFILAENRLNLEQVFAELERLYMKPQIELHEAEWMGGPRLMPGAVDTFSEVGLIVLSNKKVPEGKETEGWRKRQGWLGEAAPMAKAPDGGVSTTAASNEQAADSSGGLAQVERVRQFFPETWIWAETITDDSGQATLSYEAPDSITTWDLRAVALSPAKGLGMAETSLRVFQPFFLQADLPYSAIRGEEFPVKIALYNYLGTPQDIQVELKPSPWFEVLDRITVTVTVAGNQVGSAEFKIRPVAIGAQSVEVSARSAEAADAVVKNMIVEPEGVARETVKNVVLPAGRSRSFDLVVPSSVRAVPDSERAYVAVTGSLLAQTIEGLDQLLQMPFGCGEQNMVLFAPDAFILKYLQGTKQLKPEIQAKAELLLVTGYQRELTYRRADGSFSAFGERDDSGSLWLTAFVLKTFAQAKDLTFIDGAVLSDAAAWIDRHQQKDGSFEAVGFVHHSEMMGGVQGKDALTAYVVISLLEAGHNEAAQRAMRYLEGRLDNMKDAYELALTTYALELGGSNRAGDAQRALRALAIEDENGLHWKGSAADPMSEHPNDGPEGDKMGIMAPLPTRSTLDVEVTGYAVLALIRANERADAAQAARWLVGQRNSRGGFNTTQGTVIALQALTEYPTLSASDTEMTVTISAGEVSKDVRIDPTNFDVTQIVAVPAGSSVKLTTRGRGEAIVQGVLRYNLPAAEEAKSAFEITVDYDTHQVAVNDLVEVNVNVKFAPPEPIKAGMSVLDISVPTGFAAEEDSLARLLDDPKVKRYEVAGRRVIVYIEDMNPGDKVSLSFLARALYPVRGKGATSTAYSYYVPEWRGETVGQALIVE